MDILSMMDGGEGQGSARESVVPTVPVNQFIHNLDNCLKRAHDNLYSMAVMLVEITSTETPAAIHSSKIAEQLQFFLEDLLTPYDKIVIFSDNLVGVIVKRLQKNSSIDMVANEAHRTLSRFFNFEEQSLPFRLHFAVASYPFEGETGEALYANALDALKHSRRLESDAVVFYSELPGVRKSINAHISKQLITAVNKDEFYLEYQPVFDINKRTINGLEVLLRWEHPKYGLLAPGAFVTATAHANMSSALGEWVLKEVREQVADWNSTQKKVLFLNTSVVQLEQESFIDALRRERAFFEKAGITVYIEITDVQNIKTLSTVQAAISHIKENGYKLSLDDVGNTYTLLGFCEKLSIDLIKLDQYIIRNLKKDTPNAELVSSIFEYAKKHDIAVVAKGVEHFRQLDWLKKYTCEYVQGYLLARPLASPDAFNFLLEDSFDG